MDQTTNYNLKKPGTNDNIDIGIINDNMDAVDTQLKTNEDNIANLGEELNNLAGEGRTTETVKENADAIARIGQQINNLKFFSHSSTPDSGSIDSTKTNIWFDTANNIIKIWNGTSWQGQGAVYQ